MLVRNHPPNNLDDDDLPHDAWEQADYEIAGYSDGEPPGPWDDADAEIAGYEIGYRPKHINEDESEL